MSATAVPAGERTRDADAAFAREATKDPACPDIPLTAQPFDRDGMTFTDALVWAGLEDERKVRRAPSVGRGPGAAYSREAMIRSLRRASRELRTRVLGHWQYERWAREHSTDEVWLPRSTPMIRCFGSWPDALFAAGLISDKERRLARTAEGRGFTSVEAARFLAAARRDFGHRPSRREYRMWRLALLTHDEYLRGAVPSETLLQQRFGT